METEADPLECSKRKGPMRAIALIDDHQVIRRILEHPELPPTVRAAAVGS
ncbi:MAG: hypothetical protein ACREVR_12220 [Burkholderiales bacterium]